MNSTIALAKPSLSFDNLTSYDKDILKYLMVDKKNRASVEAWANQLYMPVGQFNMVLQHLEDCGVYDPQLRELTAEGKVLLSQVLAEEKEREEMLRNGAKLTLQSAQAKEDVVVIEAFLREVNVEATLSGGVSNDVLNTVLNRWKQR
jgi:hypothetical protein